MHHPVVMDNTFNQMSVKNKETDLGANVIPRAIIEQKEKQRKIRKTTTKEPVGTISQTLSPTNFDSCEYSKQIQTRRMDALKQKKNYIYTSALKFLTRTH